MPVKIEKVNVINLGPLGDKTFEFGKLNLIYGKNETRKDLSYRIHASFDI